MSKSIYISSMFGLEKSYLGNRRRQQGLPHVVLSDLCRRRMRDEATRLIRTNGVIGNDQWHLNILPSPECRARSGSASGPIIPPQYLVTEFVRRQGDLLITAIRVYLYVLQVIIRTSEAPVSDRLLGWTSPSSV